MNLYLLQQDAIVGYDTYDSCVVAASSESEAKLIRPDGYTWKNNYLAWATSIDQVKVIFLASDYEGEAGVILASFNAG
jgi:hypothetical protein